MKMDFYIKLILTQQKVHPDLILACELLGYTTKRMIISLGNDNKFKAFMNLVEADVSHNLKKNFNLF